MPDTICAKAKTQYETILSLKNDFSASYKKSTHQEKVAMMNDLQTEIERLHGPEFEEIYGIPYRKRLADKFNYDFVGKFSPEGLARCHGAEKWFFIRRNGQRAFPLATDILVLPFKNGKAYLTYLKPEQSPRLFSIKTYAIDSSGNKIVSEPEFGAPKPEDLGYTEADILEGLKIKVDPADRKYVQYSDPKGNIIFRIKMGT